MSYPGVGVSPGTVPFYHGMSSKVSERQVRVVELILRCLMCGLAVMAAILVGTDSQVQEIFTIRKKARFTDLKALLVDDMYHVSVMPCYDKKLEAVRDDFAFQLDSPRDANEAITLVEVDSVLTTGEVLDLIQLKGVDFKGLEESSLDALYVFRILSRIPLSDNYMMNGLSGLAQKRQRNTSVQNTTLL